MRSVLLLLAFALPAAAQTYNCQQVLTPAGFTLSCAPLGAPPPPPPPTPLPPLPSPPTAGCPAPGDVYQGSIIRAGAEKIFMTSGRVYSSLLPRTTTGHRSGEVKLGETPDSAQVLQSIELSISKCKGFIDTSGGTCYLKSRQGSWNTMVWLETSIPGVSDADARTYNLCFAKPAEGTWYFNMRYNYTECWSGTCAYVLQWNDGPI